MIVNAPSRVRLLSREDPAPLPARPKNPPRVGVVRSFRPEIQLLRAIAVLTVVIYHINPDWLPGGFVGVDVFFVISGYLITSHMIKEIETSGRLSLATFWANRARRILPAATVAIIAIAITAPFFLPNTQWTATAWQGLASAFYVQNFALAAKSVDYLTQNSADTPFQHFWSLSVEEQFYVFWPLIAIGALVLAQALARRRAQGARGASAAGTGSVVPGVGTGRHPVRVAGSFRQLALVFFAVVVVASFVYSVIEVNAGNAAAYFVTPTRVWELGIGGLLACVLGDPQRFPVLRKLLAIAGVAAILAASFLYTGAHFPGVAALLPTLGCVAVIVAGRTSGLGSLHPIVDLRPVQAIGNWSYSLYLWHFPVVTYFVALTGAHAGFAWGSVLFAVSLGLAVLSYLLVENPVRRNHDLRRHRWLALTAAGTSMTVAAAFCVVPQAAFAIYESENAEQIDAVAQSAAEPENEETPPFGAASLRSDGYDTFVPGQEDLVVPLPAKAQDEDQPFYPGCTATPGGSDQPTTEECVAANPEGTRTIAVVGDSHASQWVPALRKAVEGTDWKVVVYLRNSCPFTFAERGWEGRGLNCVGPNHEVLDRLLDTKPEKVFMTNLAVDDVVGAEGEDVPGVRGYAEVMRPLVDAGIEVYAMQDTPYLPEGGSVPDCVASNMKNLEACAFPRTESYEGELTNHAMALAAEQVEGVTLLDMTDRFCTTDLCPAVIGNVLVYRDENHVGKTYMESLGADVKDAVGLG
ncbi:acyltransferase family protein [Brevibacterium samyangense]|uniref:Acyltransferase family protein n=1 Tax=Brevibacterium samyangense TaxID=366888 RepID=A0ABP5EMR3_9MICO